MQTHPVDFLIIANNADQVDLSEFASDQKRITVLNLPNLGSAGGQTAG